MDIRVSVIYHHTYVMCDQNVCKVVLEAQDRLLSQRQQHTDFRYWPEAQDELDYD